MFFLIKSIVEEFKPGYRRVISTEVLHYLLDLVIKVFSELFLKYLSLFTILFFKGELKTFDEIDFQEIDKKEIISKGGTAM